MHLLQDGECLLFMAGIMGNYEIISLLVEKYRSIHENFLHTLVRRIVQVFRKIAPT